MVTLQNFIDEGPADGTGMAMSFPSGMNLYGFAYNFLEFCNCNKIKRIQDVYANLDPYEIIDFPYWACVLELTLLSKGIIKEAYEKNQHKFKYISNVDIDWESVLKAWIPIIDIETFDEQLTNLLFFGLPVVNHIEKGNELRIFWEAKFEEVWSKIEETPVVYSSVAGCFKPEEYSDKYRIISTYKYGVFDNRARRRRLY